MIEPTNATRLEPVRPELRRARPRAAPLASPPKLEPTPFAGAVPPRVGAGSDRRMPRGAPTAAARRLLVDALAWQLAGPLIRRPRCQRHSSDERVRSPESRTQCGVLAGARGSRRDH